MKKNLGKSNKKGGKMNKKNEIKKKTRNTA
jgi:hypothetical protein